MKFFRNKRIDRTVSAIAQGTMPWSEGADRLAKLGFAPMADTVRGFHEGKVTYGTAVRHLTAAGHDLPKGPLTKDQAQQMLCPPKTNA